MPSPRAAILAVLLCCGQAAIAEAPHAAGRLEGPAGPVAGTCSAVLIAPTLVVTAAHCARSDRADVSKAFRPGTSGTTFDEAARAQHPLYDLPGQGRRRFRFDVSVVRLVSAVPPDVAVPLPLGAPARVGEDLEVASWISGPETKADLKTCPVVQGRAGLVTLGCAVVGGESGAPVLRRTSSGFEVVAILNSRDTISGRSVAQGVDLQGKLEAILPQVPE